MAPQFDKTLPSTTLITIAVPVLLQSIGWLIAIVSVVVSTNGYALFSGVLLVSLGTLLQDWHQRNVTDRASDEEYETPENEASSSCLLPLQKLVQGPQFWWVKGKALFLDCICLGLSRCWVYCGLYFGPRWLKGLMFAHGTLLWLVVALRSSTCGECPIPPSLDQAAVLFRLGFFVCTVMEIWFNAASDGLAISFNELAAMMCILGMMVMLLVSSLRDFMYFLLWWSKKQENSSEKSDDVAANASKETRTTEDYSQLA